MGRYKGQAIHVHNLGHIPTAAKLEMRQYRRPRWIKTVWSK